MGWYEWLSSENGTTRAPSKSLGEYETAQEVLTDHDPGKAGFGEVFHCYQPGLSTASASKQRQCEKSDCLGDRDWRGHFVCRRHGTDHGPFVD